MFAMVKFGAGMGAAVLTVGLLTGCAAQADPVPKVTVTGRASTMSTPDVDAGVKGDLTNNKTAINAYVASKNGKFPTEVNKKALTPYGWTVGAGTRDLAYTLGIDANENTFCLTATGESGKTYVITSNTAVTQADACPTGAW